MDKILNYKEVEKLKQRIKELEEENKQLLERIRHSESERFNSYLHS